MRVRIGYAIVDRIMWREQITPRASFSAENPEFSGIRVILRQRPRGRIVTTNRLRLPQCQHFHSGINKIDLNQDTLGFPGRPTYQYFISSKSSINPGPFGSHCSVLRVHSLEAGISKVAK
jgi:hypothetical protein